MHKNKIRILVFIDYYLPAYKAGGPLRTVANMVSKLSDEFEFLIVTRDRDLGDTLKFESVTTGKWTKLGNEFVYYLTPGVSSILQIQRIINQTNHDILYLNSFYSPLMTGIPLFLKLFRLVKTRHIVLAPRGELANSALSVKKARKSLYNYFAKFCRLYKGIKLQASTNDEKICIGNNIDRMINLNKISKNKWINENIIVAPDLVVVNSLKKEHEYVFPNQIQSKSINNNKRIIFLSRISPIKNLDFLLRVLKEIHFEVELAIYGPIEDLDYWNYCSKLLNSLPLNIKYSVNGPVEPNRVSTLFRTFDLFAFPTKGENFGHVIVESLSVGTPVLTSDQVPWKEDEYGSLKLLPLDENLWINHLKDWLKIDSMVLLKYRKAAISYTDNIILNSHDELLNRRLFKNIING